MILEISPLLLIPGQPAAYREAGQLPGRRRQVLGAHRGLRQHPPRPQLQGARERVGGGPG